MKDQKKEIIKFVDKILDVYHKGKHEIVKSSKIGKVMLDSSFLVKDKNRLLQELGVVTYSLVKEGEIIAEKLETLITQIDEVKNKIENDEKRIGEIKSSSYERDEDLDEDSTK